MGPDALPIAKTLPIFNKLFPQSLLEELWSQAQPKKYRYKMLIWVLPAVILSAYLRRLPSLEAILADYSSLLGVTSRSTLSDKLRSEAFARLVALMLDSHHGHWNPAGHRLVILDSMPVTFSSRRRSDAGRVNDKTLGGGVLWAYLPDAEPETSPLRLLKFIHGAWNDSSELRKLDFLIPDGPVYVLDRGFFCFDLIRLWLRERVHFLMRAKKSNVTSYKVVRQREHKRKVAGLRVTLDAVVDLGEKKPMRVRLIKAVLPTGELLILVSDALEEKASSLLADYKRRWEVERFHYFVKSAVGLAHLYSFAKKGIEVLSQLAFLLAALIWMAEKQGRRAGQTLVQRLLEVLRVLRRKLTTATAWQRNSGRRLFKNCKKIKAAPA